ncbi:uncharacterized protein BT62DRAFT_1006081 [Guyanagaster necrorhizus]|uniref:Uncharacterized protein n=1 Tax=Guyanagaster necrorhizus TaxID=856835 RepID=A0A9P8ATH5_9AGAR|nr:uncharacterized protein BT62DRAFT_1006081 [Guyanagaster necrorhizus MCA 3950]KAG7445897.1 hypothetical protein BT62DRAFT_1006081 [Guyanagaster necrorhizus MCA 3950]
MSFLQTNVDPMKKSTSIFTFPSVYHGMPLLAHSIRQTTSPSEMQCRSHNNMDSLQSRNSSRVAVHDYAVIPDLCGTNLLGLTVTHVSPCYVHVEIHSDSTWFHTGTCSSSDSSPSVLQHLITCCATVVNVLFLSLSYRLPYDKHDTGDP